MASRSAVARPTRGMPARRASAGLAKPRSLDTSSRARSSSSDSSTVIRVATPTMVRDAHEAGSTPGRWTRPRRHPGLRAWAPLKLGPLLTALVLIPILALLAGLVALLGLVAPSIHLPSFDPPDLPLPDVTAPDWLRAIGDAIGAVFSVLGPALKYLAIAVAIFFGVRRTQSTPRRRAETERLGRTELVRRLGRCPRCRRGRRARARRRGGGGRSQARYAERAR